MEPAEMCMVHCPSGILFSHRNLRCLNFDLPVLRFGKARLVWHRPVNMASGWKSLESVFWDGGICRTVFCSQPLDFTPKILPILSLAY